MQWRARRTAVLGELIQNRGFKPFDFNYPIWQEDHRAELEHKIIDRYWDFEIGFETPEMFRRKLRSRMNQIMPEAIERYHSTQIRFNPLVTQLLHDFYDTETKNKQTKDNVTKAQAETLDRGSKSGRATSETDFTLDTVTDGTEDTEDHATGSHDIKRDTDGTVKEDSTLDKVADKDYNLDRDTGESKSGTKDNTTENTTNVKTDSDTTGSYNKDSDMESREGFSNTPQSYLTDDPTEDQYLSTLKRNRGSTHEDGDNHDHTVGTEDTGYLGSSFDKYKDTTEGELHDGYHEDTTGKDTFHKDTVTHETMVEHGDSKADETGNIVSHGTIDTDTHTDVLNKQWESDSRAGRIDNVAVMSDLLKNTTFVNFVRQSEGRAGYSPSKLIEDYRAIMIDVDNEIANKLDILFL